MKLSQDGTVRQIGLSVLCAFCAWILNLTLWPLVRPVTFPFFFAAVTISAWRGGQLAGLLSTLLGSIITTYFFLEPEFSMFVSTGGVLSVLIFNVACGLVIHVCDSLRASRSSADELRQSFEAVINSLEEPLSVLDHEWRFLHVNLACAKYLRLNPTEMIGNVVWDMFPTMQGTLFEDYYRRAVRERVSVSFESFHRSSENWLVVRAVPFPGGLIVSFREINAAMHRQNSLAAGAHGSWRFKFQEPIPVNIPEDELVARLFRETTLDYAEPRYLERDLDGRVPESLGDLYPETRATNVETLRAFVRSGFRLDNAMFVRDEAEGKTTVSVFQAVGWIADGKLQGVTGIRRPSSESEPRFRTQAERRINPAGGA